jgi:transposase
MKQMRCGFMGYIQGEDRNQIILLPECINDYITEENTVKIIDAFVETVNLNKLEFKKAVPSKTGRPPYNPHDLLKLLIYGYVNAIRSSRKLENETRRNLELMWLLKRLTPDYKTISDFRRDNKEALKKVFKQFTLLCKDWDLFGKKLVAVDGSKFKASNSKKNNFSEKKLDKNIKYIEEKVDQYVKELEENDKNEELDKKLNAEEINKRIAQLKNRKVVYEGYKEKLKEESINEISKSDPDARQMTVNNNGMDICYNVQTVVDDKNKLVVDFEITNNPSDQNQLCEMAMRAKEIFEVDTLECLADKGYYNADDLIKCEENKITTYAAKQVGSNRTGIKEFYPDKFKYDTENDVYICPGNQKLKLKRKDKDRARYSNFEACGKCEFKAKCTKAKKGREVSRSKNQDFLDIVDSRTEANKDKYRKRQTIIEHVFGTVKRNMNAGYFLTRRVASVRGEASLTFLAYNMKRVINILEFKEIMRRLAVV